MSMQNQQHNQKQAIVYREYNLIAIRPQSVYEHKAEY